MNRDGVGGYFNLRDDEEGLGFVVRKIENGRVVKEDSRLSSKKDAEGPLEYKDSEYGDYSQIRIESCFWVSQGQGATH